MATNLYLIRHGEAYSNVEAVLGGVRGDRGLTDRGVAQAQALARRLAGGEIVADVLYASTLPRARTTAEIVAPSLHLPINWDDDLQELKPGDADGMTVEAARARFDGFERFVREAFTPIATNGESWGSFQMRVSATLEKLILRHPNQTIVVVAHGGVIEVSFMYFLEMGPQMRGRAAFHVANTALTHWRFNETPAGRREWHLVAHNDNRHLIDLASAQ